MKTEHLLLIAIAAGGAYWMYSKRATGRNFLPTNAADAVNPGKPSKFESVLAGLTGAARAGYDLYGALDDDEEEDTEKASKRATIPARATFSSYAMNTAPRDVGLGQLVTTRRLTKRQATMVGLA